MSQPASALAFDEISRVYDATREPLDSATLERLADCLGRFGIRQLLEVGVGTGRIAGPLTESGFGVTGVDVSRKMLLRAREKGIGRLVRGTADRLPFLDASFDGALFAHVLHVLEHPRTALREACRVARLGAVALVEPIPPGEPDPMNRPETNPRQLVYQYLREEGFEIPARSGGPKHRDRALLAEVPPDQIEVVSDEIVTDYLARDLKVLEAGGSRWTLHIPPEALKGAISRARQEVGDRTVTYRRVRALARWTRPPSAEAGPNDGPSGP